jgi:hypothetical protein
MSLLRPIEEAWCVEAITMSPKRRTSRDFFADAFAACYEIGGADIPHPYVGMIDGLSKCDSGHSR